MRWGWGFEGSRGQRGKQGCVRVGADTEGGKLWGRAMIKWDNRRRKGALNRPLQVIHYGYRGRGLMSPQQSLPPPSLPPSRPLFVHFRPPA